MSETFGFTVRVAHDTAEIMDAFVRRVGELALKPGCRELVDGLAGRIPMALASGSPALGSSLVARASSMADEISSSMPSREKSEVCVDAARLPTNTRNPRARAPDSLIEKPRRSKWRASLMGSSCVLSSSPRE